MCVQGAKEPSLSLVLVGFSLSFVKRWEDSFDFYYSYYTVLYSRHDICLFVRAGNSLFRTFRSNQMSNCDRFTQIAQDKWVTMSKLLRLVRGNEQPWANPSGRSRQMSDCERISQVVQDKWATMSDSLRLLRGNEQMSNLFKTNLLKNLKSCFSMFYM